MGCHAQVKVMRLIIAGELHQGHLLQTYDCRDEVTEVVIDCRGGDTQLAISIIELLPKNVKTVALAECQSAAVYIFAFGSERLCLPSTQFLLHAGSQSIEGCDAATFEQFRKHTVSVERKMNKLLPTCIRGWDSGADRVFDGRVARRVRLADGYI